MRIALTVRSAGMLVWTALFPIAACAPWPHFERQTPEISGSLSRDGSPASGVRVRLLVGESERDCSEFWRETETNGRGEFTFPEKKRLDPFILLVMAHTDYEWGLCVEASGQFRPAIRVHEYTLTGVANGGPHHPVTIQCDLSQPELETQLSKCTRPRRPSDGPIADCSCQASRRDQQAPEEQAGN